MFNKFFFPENQAVYEIIINLHEYEDDEKGNGLCNVIASYAACAYRKGN